ncbi:MAG TPA: hypothetical protein VFB12_15205 [Ktedonobacteraceae bacterium]|nr:hypothetical protein [Ktedonobacteraceae bacterium]
MSIELSILQAQIRSLCNAILQSRRGQVLVVVTLIFYLAVGYLSLSQLLNLLHQWQVQGTQALMSGLWMLCLFTWLGMALFTLISVQQSLSQDEMVLLFTLPLRPAALFRAWYGSFFIKNLGTWMLFQVVMMGYTWIYTLGWSAFRWLLLLQIGIGVVVIGTLILALLSLRYLSSALVLGLLLLALPALSIWLRTPLYFTSWLSPEPGTILLALLLLAGLGPLASLEGRLMMSTFYVLQSKDRARKRIVVPGTRLLQSIFERRRTLTGALTTRAVLNQSRNIITWLRIMFAVVLLALYPVLHSWLVHAGLSNPLILIVYTIVLTVAPVLETAPNAISGEGSRFALFLTAPLQLQQILRAKLLQFLVPLLIEGTAISFAFGWQLGLSLMQVGFVLLASTLMIIGSMTLLVLGSTWDLDLHTIMEGMEQMFLQEEGPFSPRRIILFNAALACCALMLFLLWSLPPLVALLALTLLTGVLVAGMWRFSLACIDGILRKA